MLLKRWIEQLLSIPSIASRASQMLHRVHFALSGWLAAVTRRKNDGQSVYPDVSMPPLESSQDPKANLDGVWGSARGKNIVWFMLDSLRYDVMRGHMERGGLSDITQEGIFFDNAFSNGSWTYPSVFSFITGRYPFNVGASRIVPSGNAFASRCGDFDPDAVTIFDRLKAEGYQIRSLMDGWELLVNGTADQNVKNGYFEDRWGQQMSAETFKASPEQLYAQARGHLNELAAADQPFALYFRSLSTHFKTGFNGFFKSLNEIEHLCRSGYGSEVYERLVDGLGTIETGLITPVIRQLEDLGIRDDTIVIIHSDHGDMFWNLESDLQKNSKVGKWNMAAWTHNIEPYQGLIKVPVLMSGLGAAGAVYEDRFRLIDLVPTLLDALGIAYDPGEFDGISLRHDGDRSVLFADSADYCALGGLSFQQNDEKLICSNRLGAAAYDVSDREYEDISARRREPDLDPLRRFLIEHGQGIPADGASDHDRILEERLKGLGYL